MAFRNGFPNSTLSLASHAVEIHPTVLRAGLRCPLSHKCSPLQFPFTLENSEDILKLLFNLLLSYFKLALKMGDTAGSDWDHISHAF